jgi:hypothetical protein
MRLRRGSLGIGFLGLVALLSSACGSDNNSLPPVSTSTGGSGGSSGGDVDAGTGGSSGDGGSSSGGSSGSGGGVGPDGQAGAGGTGGAGATGGSGGSSAAGGSGGSGPTGGSGGSGATGGTGATGGSGGTGATGGSGGSGATGGSGGSGATGGSAGDGGVPPDGGTGATFRCSPTILFDSPLGRVASIPNDHLGRFGSISPDELTAAWTSGSGDIYVGERPTLKDSFIAPVKVNTVALATDRVALAPTGKTLIAVQADRAAFVGFEKSGTSGSWANSSGLEFTQVRVAFEGGGLASDPVLSGDKRSFFFVVTPPGRPSVLYESIWDSNQRSWGLPASLPTAELQPTAAGKRRRPTGTSSDDLTLFFFDEATNVERAAWRDAPNAPFTFFKDLGARAEAVPSLRCDTLYYQSEDAMGAGVFMAE